MSLENDMLSMRQVRHIHGNVTLQSLIDSWPKTQKEQLSQMDALRTKYRESDEV
jgi:hypothetical protein